MTEKQRTKIPLKDQKWLAIHYHFPPAGMVAGFRNYEVVHNIKENVKDVFVLTGKHEASTENHFLDTSSFNIYKLSNWDYRIFAKKIGYTQDNKTGTPQKKTSLQRKLLDSFPTNLILGEGGFIYILTGIFKACSIVRKNSVTHIYSSYRPYADHVIAWWVKLFFPSIYWVADFGDVQIDPILKNVYWSDFQHWCNRKILAKANLVTTVSKGLGRVLRPYHSNIFILKNGIVKLPKQAKRTIEADHSHFKISYTGSLYGERTALPLMMALKTLTDSNKILSKHLRILYAGKDFQIWKAWAIACQMEDFLKNRGLVTLANARQLQSDSQINVMLSWASPELTGWLTFKLYDYLLAGKPILSLVNGSQDPELEEVIDKYQAGKVFYVPEKNQAALQQFILEKYQNWLSNVKQEAQQHDLTAYEWKNMVENMLMKTS